jgi:hypothetical protein
MERKRKKERTVGVWVGKKIYKLNIKQINVLFVSLDGVGLSVQRILILYCGNKHNKRYDSTGLLSDK